MQPILKVNLSSRSTSLVSIPVEWERDYLGGASLAARMLYIRLHPGLEPLDPESPLLFLNGPLSGTVGPAVGRFVVCGRSPATRLWGESNCGGFWGPELRKAGYDGLWVEGYASEPVYLWIHNGSVEIHSATHLWGMDPYTVQSELFRELGAGKIHVASIGRAGEAQLPYALILVDHGRAAGRTGMGAIMGSKNLKAIAVQGNGNIPLFDPTNYNVLRSEANQELRSDATSQVLRELGTAGVAEYLDYLGEMPKKYFQLGFLGEELKISGSVIKETILTGKKACHGCVIACGREVSLEDGIKRKGPEYETLVGFGPNLMLNDLALATRLGELCDRLGVDSISMSNILGLAYRLFELGLVTPEDTGGLDLTWGDSRPLEILIRQTVNREGFGALLAQGARTLAAHFGAPDAAVQVNGLEAAYHDPRGASGMALVYATSPRGACHNQSDYFLVDIGQAESALGIETFDRQAGQEKAANVARHQDWGSLVNSLVMCLFAGVPPEKLLALLNSACGYSLTLAGLLQIGERAWNLKRLINQRLGLTSQQDRLPAAMLQPYADDPAGAEGYVPDFPAMLQAYYAARGWDTQTGMPGLDKLTELNLEWTL